jgi:hypothetical protein
MHSNIDWSNPVPKDPMADREEAPRTIRFPKELAARIEKLADASHQTFTAAALHLLSAALDEVESRQVPKKKKRG